MINKKRVAVIGTQGVPAQYGGFETLIDNIIGKNCSEGIEYTVYCSGPDYQERQATYKGANLIYLPLRANGVSSTFYDILSLILSVRHFDYILVLGVSGGIFFPIFRLLCKKRLITNIDGLEWKRNKWKGFAKLFLRVCEEFALRFSDVIIADNQAIVDYIKSRYKKKTVLIAYGSDHVSRQLSEDSQLEILQRYSLKPQQYSIGICRIEPENNVELILEAFSHTNERIIMIGNWNNSLFGQNLRNRHSSHSNISMIDSIYDLDILYALRRNCKYYIHGHSAGGTNPSLVEAMFCHCNILAYDVSYNRETTHQQAHYFRDAIDLALLLSRAIPVADCSQAMYQIAQQYYTWQLIASQYEQLYR